MSKYKILIWISLGGVIGTVLRYLITIYFEQNKTSDFPLGTFIINIAGCFVIGFVSELSVNTALIRPELRLALTSGFAGAFTTFSTFVLENYKLSQDSQYFISFLYMILSVSCGAILLYLGVLLARIITK